MLKMFAVVYLKGYLAAAMYLWPGATIQDCRTVIMRYSTELPNTQAVKSGEIKLNDIRLSCEWHERNPVKDLRP